MPDTNQPAPAPSSTTETRGRTTKAASSAPVPAASDQHPRAAHFILQGKGGVGKSFVASLIAQYLADQGRLQGCFDTDPVNGSLQSIPALAAEPVDLLTKNAINVKEVDRAHVLASQYTDRHATYVAMSRHRDGATLHYSQEAFADRSTMKHQLGRERLKDTTLDYAPQFARRRGIEVPADMQRVRTTDRAMPARDTRTGAERFRDREAQRAAERGVWDGMSAAGKDTRTGDITQADRDRARLASAPKLSEADAERMRHVESERQSRGMGMGR